MHTISDDQLAFEMEDLQQEIETLEYENRLFERYLVGHMNVMFLVGQMKSIDGGEARLVIPKLTEDEIENWINAGGATHRSSVSSETQCAGDKPNQDSEVACTMEVPADAKPAKSDKTNIPRALSHLRAISEEVKCEILLSEMEVLRIQKLQSEFDTMEALDRINVSHEELEIKSREHKKATIEFGHLLRDSRVAFDESRKRYCSEFITRHFDDKRRAKDALITKLRLKLSTMVHQQTKISTKLKRKAELSDVLTAVDLEQLRFENQQFLEQIDVKNNEVHQQKATCAKLVSQSTRMRTKIKQLETNTKHAISEITRHNTLQRKLEDESMKVNLHVCEVREALQQLNDRVENHRVPSTRSYILQKKKLDECRVQNRSWKRKVDIAKLKLSGLTSFWNKLCAKQRLIEAQLLAATSGKTNGAALLYRCHY